MTDEMTDAQVAAQVERADAFIAQLRNAIAATVVPASNLCADEHRSGLRRFADTLDAVPYATLCNLANLDAVLHGWLLELIEARLHAVGGGPTLDYADAVAFLAKFQPMIDMALKRMQH